MLILQKSFPESILLDGPHPINTDNAAGLVFIISPRCVRESEPVVFNDKCQLRLYVYAGYQPKMNVIHIE